MVNIKKLNQDNKNASQYLHDSFGFDFQKPFTVIKQDGKFTANSIINGISKKISDFSPDGYKIVLLIRYYDYNGKLERLHIATFDGKKFNIDVPRGYDYDIDTFYSKGAFEHTRKNKTAYLFIVIQKNEYLIERKAGWHDTTVKYKYFPGTCEYWSDGKGNTYYNRIKIKEINKNGKPFEWDIRYQRIKSLNEIIDKSGYLTVEYRNQLMNRVRNYKSKKRKDEFLATDYSCTIKALEALFEKLKIQIADTVKNITTYNQARLVEKAMDRFAWGLTYFTKYRKKIEEKDYDSKQYAESSEQNIRKYLDEANETLREAANETDD